MRTRVGGWSLTADEMVGMPHPDVNLEVLLPREALIAQWAGVLDAHRLVHLLVSLHVVLGGEQTAALGTRIAASFLHAEQP